MERLFEVRRGNWKVALVEIMEMHRRTIKVRSHPQLRSCLKMIMKSLRGYFNQLLCLIYEIKFSFILHRKHYELKISEVKIGNVANDTVRKLIFMTKGKPTLVTFSEQSSLFMCAEHKYSTRTLCCSTKAWTPWIRNLISGKKLRETFLPSQHQTIESTSSSIAVQVCYEGKHMLSKVKLRNFFAFLVASFVYLEERILKERIILVLGMIRCFSDDPRLVRFFFPFNYCLHISRNKRTRK